MMRRTVYPFYDVPYTVLRVIRYAALINVVSDEDKIDQRVYDTFVQIIKLSNEELNIRHFKKRKGIEYAND